jgi:hypothetical protein
MSRTLALGILGALAAVLGVLHAFDVLLYLGIVTPALPGETAFFGVHWLAAILAAVVSWIWFWAAGGLWRGDPEAWTFVVIVAVFTLLFGFIAMVAGAPLMYRAPSMILAAFALILALLPNTREAVTPTAHA